MKTRKKNSSLCDKLKREELIRRLKLYSTAAGLGAFTCSSAAQGQVVVYDLGPGISISNTAAQLGGTDPTFFIDIHADGPGNPDLSPPEWQISAPQVSTQIRIGTTMTAGPVGDERGDHADIGNASLGKNSPVLVGQGNQLLSLFGNPGSSNPADPNPGYYVESAPFGTPISRATMTPSFYADLAARTSAYPNIYYNKVNAGGYVGLEWAFNGSGSTDRRYGWAQIDVTPVNGMPQDFFSATLTKYAFKLTPNEHINAGAPEPSSLALLAAGGGGLALAMRRRKNSQ